MNIYPYSIAFLLTGLIPAQPSPSTTQSKIAPEAVSLLGKPLYAQPLGDVKKMESALAAARASLDKNKHDPDALIWLGRRLAYLWRMNEAIEVFTRGINQYPNDPRFYRHRGHRYISKRQFDRAIADLQKAAQLISNKPDEIEPDGAPNDKNIPLTTTGFSIWYHLALAKYLKGDFAASLSDWRQCRNHLGGHDDNLVAVADWEYMTLRRLGRKDEAGKILAPIRPDMTIIENRAYHRRLLMYKGLLKPEELLSEKDATPTDIATQGYGVGNWYFYNDDKQKATEIFERVVAGPNWPAFGFIAAEADLARMR